MNRTCLAVSLLCLASAAASAAPLVFGDLDGDGTVTVQDAAAALRIATGIGSSSYTDLYVGDVASPAGNVRDHQISFVDAFRILRAANGLDDLSASGGPAWLLFSSSYNLNITQDTTQDMQFIAPVFATYLVTGEVTQPTGTANTGFVRFDQQTASGDNITAVAVDSRHKYGVYLSPGKYGLYYENTVVEPTPYGAYTWSYAVPLNYQTTISDSTTIDIIGAEPPTPGSASGAISTVNLDPKRVYGSLGPGTTYGPTVSFQPIYGIATNSVYSVKGVPVPGSFYNLIITGQYRSNPGITFSFPVVQGVYPDSAGATAPTVTLPRVYPVTVKVTPPEGATVTSVTLESPLTSQQAYLTINGVQTDATTYSVAAPSGACHLYVGITLPDAPNVVRTLSYYMNTSVPSGGGTLNYAVPALPAMVTFSGHVTYPNGLDAANASVSTLGGANELDFRFSATTDSQGRFSVRVPMGRYYVDLRAAHPLQ